MSEVFLPGVTDLFGDPVPASRGKKGRPPHVPTTENRRFVQMSLACGYAEAAIAGALGISERTLNRHYFHELSGRQSARLRLEMKNMAAIVVGVESGSVSAMSLLEKKIERLRLRELSDRVADRGRAEPQSDRMGKKQAARTAAAEVTGKFAPPTGPTVVH